METFTPNRSITLSKARAGNTRSNGSAYSNGGITTHAVVLDGSHGLPHDIVLVQYREQRRESGLYSVEHPRIDVVRADDGGPHAGRGVGELDPQRLVEADRGVLRRGVVGLAGDPDQAGSRGDSDHVTPVLGDHCGEKGLRGPKTGQRIHPEGALHLVGRQLDQRPAADDSGVVDQNVHGSHPGQEVIGRSRDRFGIPDVDRRRQGVGTQGLEVAADLSKSLLGEVPQNRTSSAAGNGECQESAEAAGTPGDENGRSG